MAYDTTVSKTTSNTLGQLQNYTLRRTALETLMPTFPFHQFCEQDQVPLRSGKTLRWYRYTNLTANTTAVGEGTVGTGITHPVVKTLDATVAQYADFLTMSDLLRDTAPDAILENFAKALGFRAGLSGDNIVRGVIDAETGAEQTLLGPYLAARDYRTSAMLLQGADVHEQSSGYFEAVVHPYNGFDVANDPSTNGLMDIHKYTDPDRAGASKITPRGGEFARISGVRIIKSTNVKLSPGSPNKWRTYIFGREAVGTVSLANQRFKSVKDPMTETFQVFSKVLSGPSETNPMGLLGGFVSYKFTLVAKVLSGPTSIGGSYKYRWIDAPSSIVA